MSELVGTSLLGKIIRPNWNKVFNFPELTAPGVIDIYTDVLNDAFDETHPILDSAVDVFVWLHDGEFDFTDEGREFLMSNINDFFCIEEDVVESMVVNEEFKVIESRSTEVEMEQAQLVGEEDD